MAPASPPHPATLPEDQLLAMCEVKRLRRGGPGGQHRNKVETAVQLTHRPTGVMAEANEQRSQADNQRVAMHRLRLRLALAHRLKSEAANACYPSQRWRSRARGGKLAVNAKHADFPALLAELLDVLSANAWDDRLAADRLAISRSQLVKLLKLEPAALALLNDRRRDAGRSTLQ